MTAFEIRSQEREWGTRRTYKVNGFWSGETVVVDEYDGRIDIRWSCGGRDTGEVEDDIEATSNFAAAIADAVELARNLRLEQTAADSD